MDEFPQTFLPRRISRAADAEMMAVLEEDALVRAHLNENARGIGRGPRALRRGQR